MIIFGIASFISEIIPHLRVYCCGMVGWLCFMSLRQRGHLETAPPFTVPCEGHEARFLHRSHRESNPGLSRDSPLHYRCTTPASGMVYCTKVNKEVAVGERIA